MTTDFANKRTSERMACTVPVDGKEGTVLGGLSTTDVSKDGIGFLSNKEVTLHQKIAIELALSPDEDPVLVLGVVKWVRPVAQSSQYRAGLKFEMILSGSQKNLDDNLHEQLQKRGFDLDDIDVDDLD